MSKLNNHVPLLIRPTAVEDLPSIAKIHTISWRNTYQGHMPQDFLDSKIANILADRWEKIELTDQDVVLVAQTQKIVGFIAVWCEPEVLIDNLHVLPEQRSQKIGTKLMKAAALELISRGQKQAYLWALESNKRAIKFYEKLGGRITEIKIRDIYGITVRSVKIQWEDLKVILDAS